MWIMINNTVAGATDLHEGCRIKAAEEGVLEYMLMKCIPALSKEGYYGDKVRYLHKFSQGLFTLYCS